MIDLDFSLLPEIKRSKVLMGMPADVEKELKQIQLPETLDRLKGACRFLDEVSSAKEMWLNHAYLRAGLSEFRQVAQSLYWDIGRRKVHSPEESKNPLVHLVFRLRRIAVYLENISTKEHETSVVFHFDGEDHNANVRVLLIDNVKSYLESENLDKYKNEDINRICDWFEEIQPKYGASAILSIGVLLYCLELCEVYSNRKEIV